MKKVSFILAFLGIFALLLILNLSRPMVVNNPLELQKLTENTKVQTTGKVISEYQFDKTRIIKLNNSIEAVCRSCPSYINRTLSIVGIKEKYMNKTQIIALRISAP